MIIIITFLRISAFHIEFDIDLWKLILKIVTR